MGETWVCRPAPQVPSSSLARVWGHLSLSMVLGGALCTLAAVRSRSGRREETRGPARAHGALSPSPCPPSLRAAPTGPAQRASVSEVAQLVLTAASLQSCRVPPGDALCLVPTNSQVSSSEFKVIGAKMMERSWEGALGLWGARSCRGKGQGLAALLVGLLLCARLLPGPSVHPHRDRMREEECAQQGDGTSRVTHRQGRSWARTQAQ